MNHCPRSMFVATLLASASLLTACGSGTGAAAGDTQADLQTQEDIIILSAFTGVYDLTGNWKGSEGDAAMLVVRDADASGNSTVVLYDIDDDIGNCTARPIEGEAVVDRFTDDTRVFMNDLFDFDSAVLSLAESGALLIEFIDTNDIDLDGDRFDLVTYQAQAVGLMEGDLPGRC